MYFSSVSKHLVLVPILVVVAIQLFLIRSVSCLNMTNAYLHHKCYVTQGKYKPGSKFEEYLNEIIVDIPMGSNFSLGFEMSSKRVDSTFVSVIHQCRGDSYGPKCRSCYATALSGLQRRCPKNKGGIIWYDQCFLEISGVNTMNKIDYDNNYCMSNPKNVSGDKISFDTKWMKLLRRLTDKAFSKNKSFASGEEMIGTKKLYAMVQCGGDTSFKGCGECFGHSLVQFQDCTSGKQGARVLGRSCSFRFEFYPFLDTKTEPT